MDLTWDNRTFFTITGETASQLPDAVQKQKDKFTQASTN